MSRYKGRFAPSPTGPMHPGTLLAALGSYLQARRMGGTWHVRIDDIDLPRSVTGAADSILKTLESYGLAWDGPVIYQSGRNDAYCEALDQLLKADRLFHCTCSRRKISKSGRPGINGHIYPGTCRTAGHASGPGRSIRLRVPNRDIVIHDRIQGEYQLNLAEQVGDFVLRRSDGLFAYHLATVVDDGAEAYTEIVRGNDLLPVTPQQVWLQQCLDLPVPQYAHLPVLTDSAGQKLGKSTGAQPIDRMSRADVFAALLPALGIAVPAGLCLDDVDETLDWATRNWELSNIPAANRTW